MDDNSTILFNFFFNRIVNTFQKMFRDQQNYIIDKFNTYCKDDMECQDTTLFCNKTSFLCQCATFFVRNEIAEKCEFQQANFTQWLKNNGTVELWDTSIIIFKSYHLPWSAICVLILGVICMFSCVVYICLGNEKKNNGSEVLSKQQKKSIQIEMHH